MQSYDKYYNLIKEQSEIYDKSQNCNIGQTWKYHLEPVIKNACMLAKLYGANEKVVELAALFHDYANLIDYNNSEKHHIIGAELTKTMLLQDGYEEDFVNHVCKCILNHRASVLQRKYSIEEICVADADAMSHLDNVVELLLWRGYLKEDIETANNFVKNKIKKSYAKMSDETKALVLDQYNKIMDILF